ncbi:hypothetical protein FUA48_04415 [Flavobacterium alkalisoli]|uniref:PcfJ-like protein n=1 Tax=Flavobacterium alkalisoli TaxID=2602769 RepID=A0A5B9FP80_9FLAO|nr:PcfJ domain-containing protein [Flavobacterium alkalisoli]QEE48844.1 hypothetical protein FUA48_04415 [Flavobacterium alkalisoli]
METQVTMAMAAMEVRATGFVAIVERASKQPQDLIGKGTTIESAICHYFSTMSAVNHVWRRETFKGILIHIYSEGCYTMLRNPEFIGVLANMSFFGNKMVRSVDAWKKKGFTAEDQLKSFVKHCFAQYDVPEFMVNAFGEENKVHMLWYIQMGRGDSIKKLSGFPVAFTCKMAHEFRNTPSDMSVNKAIRRAQALGFGAEKQRAELIAWSALSDSFENEAFRTELVKFFATVKGEISLDVFQTVLEYVFYIRAQNAAFTMKGRTWDALLRQAVEWEREMLKRKAAESYNQWKPAAITNFYIEKEDEVFSIIQLTNSEAIYEEGYEMSHCVADYTDACAGGESAIFSLRKFTHENSDFERLATIEVDVVAKEIVQAQARYNEMISEKANEVIIKWAKQEGLSADYDFYVPVHNEPQPAIQLPQAAGNPPMQRQNYEPYRDAGFKETTSDRNIGYIIIAIMKILWLIAKCSQE